MNQRRQFFANRMHFEIWILIYAAALLPTIAMAFLIYYIFTNVVVPDAALLNPVTDRMINCVLFVTPLFLILLMLFALRLTNTMVGPFNRLVRELDEIISGERKGSLFVRKNDKFTPLVEKINVLLERMP